MTLATDALHLHRLTIANFMRVEALTVDALGHHVLISGKNGAGKTSAIDAIWAALGGKSARSMPEPVHRGAERGTVRLDLGEYLVERVWSEKGNKLIVSAIDGSKISRPQQLLDGLLGKYSLDPIAFLVCRPQDQVDDVLTLCGVEPPIEAVKAIVGEQLPARPLESADTYLMRLSADETGLFYVRRRDAGRQVDQKAAALAEEQRRLDSQGGPLPQDAGERSATSLLDEIDRLGKAADARRQVESQAAESARALRGVTDRLANLGQQRAVEAQRAQTIEDQIADLTRRLAAQRETVAELDRRIAKGQDIEREAIAAAQSDQAAVDLLPDPTSRIAALRQQIAQVESENRRTAARRLMAERIDQLAHEHAQAQVEHGRLDTQLAALRDLRVHLLDGVDLGVPGLEVGQGELRLDGVTFRQASQAQQIRVACAVAMRLKPKLRLLRVDDGEHLDIESKRLLLELAQANNFQVVMTAVADIDGLRVEILDDADAEERAHAKTEA